MQIDKENVNMSKIEEENANLSETEEEDEANEEEDYDPENLEVFSREVLKMISKGKEGWEKMLPTGIAELIKKDRLFGYDPNKFIEIAN